MSINILENKLGDNDVGVDLTAAGSSGQEDSRNLYRITTEHGHVKWFCFEHYKETYRHTALSSFVQSIKTSGGIYDPHLGQVTISLKSDTTSRDYSIDSSVRRQPREARPTGRPHVEYDYRIIATWQRALQFSSRSLSNTKLRSLQLSNLYLLGPRTSNLPSNFTGSRLQSFGFHGLIEDKDKLRLMNIISNCSELVELRLDSDTYTCLASANIKESIVKNLGPMTRSSTKL
ncbi:hypothetical protein BGZ96_008494 [Linnemannia gamsii]|uniref:Uncharacterized protein n=1 Tax=Linnemannia gamsii TaxID=64522 RepID=A0ABQ7JY51_9FUNG|nr:hypothetical protein BGZ96_008494 [Linnemannia gamsii]